MLNSMINSSWVKSFFALLSVLFSEEGKESGEEGKPSFVMELEIE